MPGGRAEHGAAGPKRCALVKPSPGRTVPSEPFAVALVLAVPFFGLTAFGPDFMNSHSVLTVFIVNAWKNPERYLWGGRGSRAQERVWLDGVRVRL